MLCPARSSVPFWRVQLGLWAAVVCAVGGSAGAVAAQEAPLLREGLYRLDMRQASTSKLPLMGKTHSAFVSISLAELRSSPEGIRQSHRVCGVRFETGFPLVEMVMPEPMLASLWRPSYPVEISAEDDGWRYRADFGTEHVGYRPDGKDSKLPRKADHPAVIDSDGDGHPGATLHLDVPILDPLELYVVQRGHAVLEGRVGDDGAVDGIVRVEEFEQRVIGADPYFLRRTPRMKPDREHSHFRLTPVPESTTCETLLQATGTAEPSAGEPPSGPEVAG